MDLRVARAQMALLPQRDWVEAVVTGVAGRLPHAELQGLRVAIVIRDSALIPKVEYAALGVRESGARIGPFTVREAAEVWLRHGELVSA